MRFYASKARGAQVDLGDPALSDTRTEYELLKLTDLGFFGQGGQIDVLSVEDLP